MTYKHFTLAIAGITLAATSANAATVFLTNNTTPKTLAVNEGDAGVGLTNGSVNNGLDGDTSGDSTVLTLSAEDGGGTITITSINVSGGNNLFMDGDSMGHANDKWGASQNWTFSLDQTISFDALTFKTINETMTLHSAAWKDDAAATGTNWSFASDGTLGTFSFDGTSDFTSAGVSDVVSGTAITFGFLESSSGGEELSSFTISPIPEPSAMLLGGLGSLLLFRRRRG